jgi:hypothetical protein
LTAKNITPEVQSLLLDSAKEAIIKTHDSFMTLVSTAQKILKTQDDGAQMARSLENVCDFLVSAKALLVTETLSINLLKKVGDTVVEGRDDLAGCWDKVKGRLAKSLQADLQCAIPETYCLISAAVLQFDSEVRLLEALMELNLMQEDLSEEYRRGLLKELNSED